MRSDAEIRNDIETMFYHIINSMDIGLEVDFVTDSENYSKEEKDRFLELVDQYGLVLKKY